MSSPFRIRESWGVLLFLTVYALGLSLSLTGMLSLPVEVFYLLPIALIGAYFFFFQFGFFTWATIALIPLSVNFTDLGGGLGLSIPVEPMVFGLALVFLIRMVSRGGVPRVVLRHPLTILIALQTLWVVATLVTSTYPGISAKFLVARLVYIGVFYLFFLKFFREKQNIRKFIFLYVAGFLPVILYALQRIGSHGFARPYSPVMAEPFYSDHTILGVCIALLLPGMLLFWFNRRELVPNPRMRTFIALSCLILILGVVFSYSRAAWLSLIGVAVLRFLLHIRLSYGLFFTGLALLVGLIYMKGDDIVEAIRAREIRSGDSFFEHAQSVANVNTDESNLERINRWSCAWRMYQDRPVWGFGPGTYEKNYAPYQLSEETTRISSWDGDRGDAHSEYFSALSEQGFLGLVFLLMVVFYTLYMGMRVYYNSRDRETRVLALGVVLGLFSYYIHGGVNSFLDIDKAASLFWAMTGMLVALEIYHKNAESSQDISNICTDLEVTKEPGYLGGDHSEQ